MGAGITPVPVRATLWGLFGALSLIVTLALRVPVVAGVKKTDIVQVAFTPRELGHSLFMVKSAELVPVTLMLLMFKVAEPLLVSVIV
jgi:hypothetical protein